MEKECCGNCLYFNGEMGGSECNPDHFEFCDEHERYVYKDWHCLRWEKKVEPC